MQSDSFFLSSHEEPCPPGYGNLALFPVATCGEAQWPLGTTHPPTPPPFEEPSTVLVQECGNKEIDIKENDIT